MKHFTSIFKFSSIFLFVLFELISCSKKSTESTTSNLYRGAPYDNMNIPQEISSIITQAKSHVQCGNGARLTNDVVFKTTTIPASGNRTTLYGPYSQGSIGGNVSQIYVGISSFNDIMFIAKVTDGSTNVLGYNVIISMCSQSGNDGTPYISDQRALTDFAVDEQRFGGIVIDSDNHCGAGSIDAARMTYLKSASYTYTYNGSQITLPPYDVWTTFYKPTCNGQY